MTVLSPGTLLQSVYLQERLVRISPGRFIEIGPDSGEIAQLLRFADEIGAGRYLPITADHLMAPHPQEKADLVISCMVMEHLNETCEFAFMTKSAEFLN